VIDNCHAKGKLVGVWVDKDVTSETLELYSLAIEMGVDFICTDFPMDAIGVRDKPYTTTPSKEITIENISDSNDESLLTASPVELKNKSDDITDFGDNMSSTNTASTDE